VIFIQRGDGDLPFVGRNIGVLPVITLAVEITTDASSYNDGVMTFFNKGRGVADCVNGEERVWEVIFIQRGDGDLPFVGRNIGVLPVITLAVERAFQLRHGTADALLRKGGGDGSTVLRAIPAPEILSASFIHNAQPVAARVRQPFALAIERQLDFSVLLQGGNKRAGLCTVKMKMAVVDSLKRWRDNGRSQRSADP
jgi:hypothetical protein